ncbi:MAG: sialate O-acetylesterase [Phocaeicola sp.]|nr:sialate O-acetylesterase [Phocaeicola sp.]
MRKVFFLWSVLFLSCAFAKEPIKIACVGNSITYGTGLQHRETEAYPIKLQQMLGNHYLVENFGKPGATLLYHGHRPYVQQEEFQKALQFKGDMVVIHLGINDTDPRNWPNYQDEFVRDYLSLIDYFRVSNPEVRILIAKMTPLAVRHHRFESGTRDWHQQIQLAIERVAHHANVELFDFFEPLYPYPNFLKDAVHPDKYGHQIMAKTVYGAITGNYGGLQMPALYTDNMVLQCQQDISIQGIANANEEIKVQIAGQTVRTKSGLNGKWSVSLQPLKAGGPYTLTVSTKKKKLTFHNVLAGEVWLCSGQSNMEFMLEQSNISQKELSQINTDQIRLYDMKARWRTDNVVWNEAILDSLNHLIHFTPTKWTACTTETAKDFSAIAYYFGKMLQDSLHVPIGLICNAVGGSPTESWIDRWTLEYEFPAILRNWNTNDFVQDWVRGRARHNIEKSTDQLQRHPYHPAYLYESGILPMKDFTIKGVIWYQGESNAHNIDTHERLFKLLVRSWRTTFKQEYLPFYFVQLSSMNRPSWTWFRDSQRRLLKEIPNTGMAVSSDVGDSLNVHPTNKRPVGERLARWALSRTYHKKITPSGPLIASAMAHGRQVQLTFDYGEKLHASNGQSIIGFEVSSDGDIFFPAQAEPKGQNLIVWSKEVPQPRFVRYAWTPFTRANLVNGDNLPASTFRIEIK